MSIEKLSDLSKVYVEKSPYTQVFNSVIEGIKDNDAFRLYVYLSSKSREWSVVKEWTAKQCLAGERKAKQCWAYLERCGLLEYVHLRNENGKFEKHDMRILNGSKFNPEEPFLKPTGAETAPLVELSTETSHHRCNNPPSGETTRVVFAPLPKKDLTNKDLNKENKSFCSKTEDQKKNSTVSGTGKHKLTSAETTSFERPKQEVPQNPPQYRPYNNQQKHSWADKPEVFSQINRKPCINDEPQQKHVVKNITLPDELINQLPYAMRPKRLRGAE